MDNLRYIFPLFIFFLRLHDAAGQPVQISGVINHYAAVEAIDTCSGGLTVSDTTGFRAGAAVLLVQMQGADISAANNSLYGTIQDLRSAGRFERAVIDSVDANTLYVGRRLVFAYDVSAKLQVVSIPQYSDVTVSDTLRCKPWNGSTGGVLAFRVAGTLTLNAPVIADGAGFRGGAFYVAPANNCNFLFPETAYFYPFGSWRGSYKGEGIALPIAGKEFGRGPQANGGGGGNDHNSGGGGGANMADGGTGGNNDEPGAFGCDGYYPGLRGYGISAASGRMFMGGGGGAGHSNNNQFSAGGNGGGIIVAEAGVIEGTAPVFSANGQPALNADGDGAGGGGAGGTIRLSAGAVPPNLTLRANGGDGGNSLNNNQNRCFGPGGGGSGGRITTNTTSVSSLAGGKAGTVVNSAGGCNGTTSGATDGSAGSVENLMAVPESDAAYPIPRILAGPVDDTACSGEPVFFTVQTNAGNWAYQWQQNSGAGWQNIAGGNYSGYSTDSLVISGATVSQSGVLLRCLVQRPGCVSKTSPAAALTVIPAPAAGFTTTVSDYSADFINQSSASSFLWDFGDGVFSTSASPQHTYAAEGTYTVTLYAIEPCDTATATQTVIIALAPAAGFSVPDTVNGCQSALVDFDNTSSSNATAWQWSFPGGSPAASTDKNPSITYTLSGTYTAELIASNNAGADTLEQTFAVQIEDFPTAGFIFTALPGGVVHFDNFSQQATSYVWDFGDGSPTAAGFNIDHQYAQSGTYTVTLVAGNSCGVSVLQQSIEVAVAGVASAEPQGTGLVRLFPNPASDGLIVDCSGAAMQPIDIQIFNSLGDRVFLQTKHIGEKIGIDLSGFPAGVYVISIRFSAGMFTGKIVKR